MAREAPPARPFGYYDALLSLASRRTATLREAGENGIFSGVDDGDDTNGGALTVKPVYGANGSYVGRNLHRVLRDDLTDGAGDATSATASDEGGDPFDGHDSLLYCHVPALLRYTTETSTTTQLGSEADFTGGNDESGDVVGGGNLAAIAYAASAGILLALEHANNGDGSVAPELEGLNERCPIRYTAEILDKGGSGLDSVTALAEMVTRPPWPEFEDDMPIGEIDGNETIVRPVTPSQPCAAIGAHVSSASTKLASLAAVFDLPVVSSSAMSPELNDLEQYPTFLRTHTDVGGFGTMAVSYLQQNLGIERFGLLFTNDGYGYGFSRSVLAAGAAVGAEVVGGGVPYARPSTDDEDDAELRASMRALANTGCNYFVANFYAESFAKVMSLAGEYNITGPGKFWLISGTADMAPYILGGALKLPKDSPAVDAIRGSGLYFCEGGVPGLGGAYDKFTKIWSGLSDDALGYINRKQPLKPNGEQYAFPTALFEKRPHHVVTFSYDAGVGLALSACEALENSHSSASERRYLRRLNPRSLAEKVSFSGQAHRDAFANSSFQGASGFIEFSQSFPTRTAKSSYFVMANLRSSEVNETHVTFRAGSPVSEGSMIVNYFDTAESTWKQLGNNQFIYSDGSNVPPVEMVPVPEESGGLTSGQVVGITIVAILVPVIAIVLFLHKRTLKKQRMAGLWAVKPAELLFDDPPVVVGQGTFGLVLLANYRGTQVAVKRVLPPRPRKRKSNTSGSGHRSGNGQVSQEGHQSSGSFAEQLDSKFDTIPHEERVRRASMRILDIGEDEEDEVDEWDDNISGMHEPQSLGMISGVQKTLTDMNNRSSFGGKVSSFGGRMSSGQRGYRRLRADFEREMQHLSRLRHPCICTVMGAVTEAGSEPALVMEYMSMGSLFGLLHNETVPLSGELLLPILRDVAKGLRFLHAAIPPVVHGDLKSANILVDVNFHAKVADFGLSQKKRIGAAGTPYWMAPELLRGESDNSPASDVYSFGIILYEAYSRKTPYEGEEYDEVVKLVANAAVQKRPPIPPDCPPQIQSMMADCLVDAASDRPTSEELDVRLQRLAAENVNPGETLQSHQLKKLQGAVKAESIFYDQFPKKVAEALREGRKVEPEKKECVTIFFSDIVGFTVIASKIAPIKVSEMLDRLYSKFDELSQKHNVFKVETVGDAYMAVANLVQDQPDHSKRIADFSIDALQAANGVLIDEEDPSFGFLSIRVGLHSGPVVASVVGSRNLKFSIFGDTVNVAARMETNSETNRIHCSENTYRLLRKQAPEVPVQRRGTIDVKGKGKMRTFWVNEEPLSRRGSADSSCSTASTESAKKALSLSDRYLNGSMHNNEHLKELAPVVEENGGSKKSASQFYKPISRKDSVT